MTKQDCPTAETVLIVEDEPFIRAMLVEELQDDGYAVFEAASADAAVAILASRTGPRIRVVLTDLRMPGNLDGGALVRVVRTRYPAIKVVMLSAELPETSLRRELDAYFTKPCDIAQLTQSLRALVG